MKQFIEIHTQSRCIVHFKEDEDAFEKYGKRIVYYQVSIGPESLYSPSKDFIRFSNEPDPVSGKKENQINGWIPVEDLVIDEVLSEITSEITQDKEEAA